MKTLSLEEYDSLVTKWVKGANSRKKQYSQSAVFMACELVFVMSRLNPDADLQTIREEIGKLASRYSDWKVLEPVR